MFQKREYTNLYNLFICLKILLIAKSILFLCDIDFTYKKAIAFNKFNLNYYCILLGTCLIKSNVK